MLEFSDNENEVGASKVAQKPAFRQRKALGKKRQRSEENEQNDEPEIRQNNPPSKQLKFSSKESTVVQKQEKSFVKDTEGVKDPDNTEDSKQHVPDNSQDISTKAMTKPIKAPPASIRTVTITDFQPDVCKDFHQTGFCGYGDTCKFLHIRDELRAKKPIAKDWKIKEADTAHNIPFKCVLCKQDYKRPVKTDCEHIFCQSCFLDRYKRRKPNCYICGKDTGGTCTPVQQKELAKLISPP